MITQQRIHKHQILNHVISLFVLSTLQHTPQTKIHNPCIIIPDHKKTTNLCHKLGVTIKEILGMNIIVARMRFIEWFLKPTPHAVILIKVQAAIAAHTGSEQAKLRTIAEVYPCRIIP